MGFSDSHHFRKTVAGWCMVVGPLLALVAFIVSPALKTNSAAQVAEVARHQDGYLLFQTRNQTFDKPGTPGHKGFGIENLRKRLCFLYGEKFELNIDTSDNFFTAFLKVPLT